MKQIISSLLSLGILPVISVFSYSRPANAAFIRPNTVSNFSSQFSSGFNGLAVNTINGSGMPVGFDENNVHAPYTSGNHWTTNSSTTPTNGFIEWGFNTPQDLSAMYVWNHQSTRPPADNTGYDVTSFDLTLFDTSDNVLLSFNNLSLRLSMF